MGGEVEKKAPEQAQVKDLTKPWRRQFCEVKEGPEPAFNGPGFWPRPRHGFELKER